MKTRKILISIILFSLIITGCSARNSAGTERIDAKTLQKIQEKTVSGDLPSVQIAVIDQDRLVWSGVFSQDSGPNFVYMNGSVQKVVDATAVLQLYERGLIDLDADISSYIPFQVEHPDYPDIPISTRMLLSHRSGLDAVNDQFAWDTECIFYPEYRAQCNPETKQMSLEEYLSASFTPGGSNYDPGIWIHKPGEKYHYSVSAYPLLRYLIEQVTGIPYPDYMEENIFEPLGMRHSGFSMEDYFNQHAVPFTRIDGENIKLPIWNGNGYMMRTTAEDMAKFMLAHMGDGEYNQFQLLAPETVRLMQTKTSRGKSILNPRTELADSGYGLGLIHYQGNWMGHGGSTVGYQSLWMFNSSKRCGIIIHTNANGILGGKDDFLSVWEHVAAIRDHLMSQLNPLAAFEKLPWGIILLWAAAIVLSQFIRHWARKKRSS